MLVAGCGYVGTELSLRLLHAGHAVFALRRRADLLPAAIHAVCADLTQADSLERLPGDLDVVFYTAAADDGSEAAYRAAYVDGLRTLTRALSEQGQSPKIVFTSSTAVYGQTSGQWVDETSATSPTHHSGRLLLEAESILQAQAAPHIVLRLGGIYGPGRDSLLRDVRAGKATYAAHEQYSNRIHRDDCAGALVHVAELEAPERIYLGVDDDPAPRREVLEYLARLTSAPVPQASSATPSRRGSNKRCKNTRLIASGYRLAHPSYREGYTAMLAAAS
jgi:nucleoside-diphosphate-sugar epimerase